MRARHRLGVGTTPGAEGHGGAMKPHPLQKGAGEGPFQPLGLQWL